MLILGYEITNEFASDPKSFAVFEDKENYEKFCLDLENQRGQMPKCINIKWVLDMVKENKEIDHSIIKYQF